MKSNKPVSSLIVRWSVATALLTFVSANASAQTPVGGEWYIGAAVGYSKASIATGNVFASIRATGATSATVSSYDSDSLFRGFAGYRFNPNLAVEAAYGKLGQFEYQATAVPTASQIGNGNIKGSSLSLLGTLPMGEEIIGYARVGIANMKIEQSFNNPAMGAAFANGDASGTKLFAGLGLEYAINEALSLRAEYEHYQLSDNRITTNKLNAFSLGLLYNFGRTAVATAPAEPAKPAPAAAPAPTPPPVVAQAPAPAPAPARPQPATPPAPPEVLKVTLAASALFDSEKAELKPAGKQELDKLAQDLGKIRYDMITVTGHTDRIGSSRLNASLSQQRADAVKAYLVAVGVPGVNIMTKGVSGEKPVTTADQCKGPLNDTLRACLAPDRRVEVEVSGVRNP